MLLVASIPAYPASIVIVNADADEVGFNDTTPVSLVGINPGTTLGEQRMFAVQYVADIWGSLLESQVTIEVETQWVVLPCSQNSGVLGSAGPATIHGNFTGATVDYTWFPAALADALAGADLSGGLQEINMNINITLDDGSSDCLNGATWYYGLDNNRPFNTVDIVPVVLHELGHGLGFITFVNLDDEKPTEEDPQDEPKPEPGAMLMDLPDIFLLNIRDTEAGKDWPDMTNEERYASASNDSNVVWTGPNVTSMAPAFVTTAAAFSDGFMRLHAPQEISRGSSISHWTSDASPSLLMRPSISGSLFDDVDLTLDLMRDIGWTTLEDVIFRNGFESIH